MTLHWELKNAKEMIALLGVISIAAVLAGALLLAGTRARGDPVAPTSKAQAPNSDPSTTQSAAALQFTVFTSPSRDYRFEAPEAWRRPADPQDLTREAIFVGPVDQSHHRVVFLTVSRYPRRGTTASIESVITQLQGDRDTQVLDNETLLVDRHPARLLTIQERIAEWTPDNRDFVFKASWVIVEHELDIYVLEYVSSPELYMEYRPIFDRLVRSFHIVATP